MDDEAKEAFATKLDAFAATLEPAEQAMLVALLVGEEEVTGFGAGLGWPGIGSLLPDAFVGNGATTPVDRSVNGVGGETPDGVFVPGRT